MKEIIILGTGGNCLDILDAILAQNESGKPGYTVRGFLDDNEQLWNTEIAGCRVLGALHSAPRYPLCFFINGIGSYNNYWRKPEIIASTGIPVERFATIIHPQASVSRLASIGPGTVVLPHATIGARARIGQHVMILPNAVISHDVAVGDYTCIASSVCLAGAVQVGTACYLGAQSAVNNGVRLGDFSMTGMGSIVLKDVPTKTLVVGVPAHALRPACERDPQKPQIGPPRP